MARHAVNHAANVSGLSARFPAGTLIVNLAGCLVIGALAGLLAADRLAMRPHWREFVFVGLLGGFTTFSTFGLDTLALARTQPGAALLNVAMHVAGGLLAVWIGYVITAR
jgi:CrcB protein